MTQTATLPTHARDGELVCADERQDACDWCSGRLPQPTVPGTDTLVWDHLAGMSLRLDQLARQIGLARDSISCDGHLGWLDELAASLRRTSGQLDDICDDIGDRWIDRSESEAVAS